MVSKVSQKKNLSSIQVIKTLEVLLQGDFTMQEIIERLNKTELTPVFNNSVISKYINTCRYIGIEVPKIHNKYFVSNLPFGLKLTDADTDALKTLQFVVQKDMISKNISKFKNFVTKLNRHSKRNITTVVPEEFVFSFELFERAVAKKMKVKLLFKNKDILDCIPLKITKEGNKTFFIVHNKRVRTIDTNRLAGIQILDEKFVDPLDGELVTVFKLSGKLAQRYQARENEKVELHSDGTIFVTNRNENKDVLFARLMRYENLCEIIRPKVYREEFIQLINDTLRNYGK